MILVRALRPFHQRVSTLGMCNPCWPHICDHLIYHRSSMVKLSSNCRINSVDLNVKHGGKYTACGIKHTMASVLPTFQVRWYAKKAKKEKKEKKEKGGKKSTKAHVELSEEELQSVVDFQGMVTKMEQSVHILEQEYRSDVAVRLSAAAIEPIPVTTPDGKFSIVQLGQVAQKDPDTVVINMTATPQYLPDVKKALLNFGQSLNPQQEGLFLFVPIPKLTREYRQTLAENSKTLCDATKNKLRDIQNKTLRTMKKTQDEHSSDLVHNVQETIHITTHEFVNQAEELLHKKRDELGVTK